MNQQKILFLALIGAIVEPQTLHAKVCVNPVTVVCPTISCSSNVIFISQADLGPSGITISNPGQYCVIENLTWAPPIATDKNHRSGTNSYPDAAITITSSNVLLDLNGYMLQQSGAATNAVGIFVTNGTDPSSTTDFGTPLNNIIIKNGTIQNIATAGILVNKVNEFLLENLYIVNNGYSGYILCPCRAQRAGGIIYPSFVGGQIPSPFLKNHIWRNIHCDSNYTTQNNVFPFQGAGISAVDQILIENCTFNNNAGNGIISETVGLELLTNTNVVVLNCQANGNSCAINEGGATGFSAELSNFIFENCQANSNQSLYDSEGFDISPTDTNILNGVFTNCQANYNALVGDMPAPGSTLYAYGFDVENLLGTTPGFGVTFINCVANNQTSTVTNFTGSIESYGYYLDLLQDVQIENCIACHNTALSNGIGDGEGFNISGQSDITLTHCNAEYNRGDGGVGFSEQYNVFTAYNCNLINCRALGDPTDPYGVGIYLGQANNCVVEKCLIESNAYDGILLYSATGPCPINAQNVIKHNQILAPNPLLWGQTGRWAIEDLSAVDDDAPQNTYYDNYAWNYPGDNGLFTNYSTGVRQAGGSVDGLGNAYIAPWTIGDLPPPPAGLSKITNLDITNGPCVSD